MDYLEQSHDFERQLVFLETRYGLGGRRAAGASVTSTTSPPLQAALSTATAADMSKTVSMPNLEKNTASGQKKKVFVAYMSDRSRNERELF